MKARAGFVFALVVVAAASGAYQFGRAGAPLPPQPHAAVRPPVREPELAAQLRRKFGPTKNSSNLEEWIVRDFFQDERRGVFVDVGANHHQSRNNTYYLETALGWSGVAIEPQARFAEGYKDFRPRTVFVPLFVSDVGEQDAVLYIPTGNGNHRVASQNRAFTESFGVAAEATTVRTTTLDAVLDRLRIAKIDYLSMDIELAEPQALAGFSIERFAPRLVGIEAHEGVQQQILEYFTRQGYVLIGKYLDIDRENYWFAPTGAVKDVAADGHH